MKKLILLLLLFSISLSIVAQKVNRTVDDFTGKITITTTLNEDARLIKVINGERVTTYLSMKASGSIVTLYKRGVWVIFDDGTKWSNLGAEVDCDVNRKGNGYDYSIFVSLSEEDIKIFNSKRINKTKLYIFTENYPLPLELPALPAIKRKF